MAIPIFWKLFAFSLTAVPVCLLINKMLVYLMAKGFHSTVMALTGVSLLATYLYFIYWVCNNSSTKHKIKNYFFYVFAVFSFTSVVVFGIGLEMDGYISDFLTEYMKSGEPYLTSPYGGAICYFDGFFMYPMYLWMMYAISNGKGYRSVGMYWSGTIINSMIVLFLALLTGRHGVCPASILNIPYAVLPVIFLWKLLQEKPKLHTNTPYQSLSQRPMDVAFIFMLIFTIFITVLRGLAVLNDKLWFVRFYLNEIEPFLLLDDPCPFPKMQMLQNLYYFVPFQMLSIYALATPGCSWMPDLMLFYAGAIAQGQFSHVFSAIHSGTPDVFRIPEEIWVRNIFWTINLIYTLVPHFLLLRCLRSPEYFSVQNKQSAGKKTKSK